MTTSFDVKDLERWEPVSNQEVVEFVGIGGRRAVRIEVNATGRVSVFAGSDVDLSEGVLVGSSDGLFEVAFSAEGTAYARFEMEPGVACFISSLARSHQVESEEFEVFTTIAPLVGPNQQYDRMLRVMRQNEARREKAVAAEINALREAAAEHGRTVRQQEAIEKGRVSAEDVDAAIADRPGRSEAEPKTEEPAE